MDLTKTYEGKPCKKCGGVKRYARNRNCVACKRENDRKRNSDPVRRAKNNIARDAYYATPEGRNKRLEHDRQRNATPERKRANKNGYLKRIYGITIKDFDHMFYLQGGVCAICPTELTNVPARGGNEGTCVDHDHQTGNVRGLLCSGCNLMIGLAKEDTNTLRNAITYLETA